VRSLAAMIAGGLLVFSGCADKAPHTQPMMIRTASNPAKTCLNIDPDCQAKRLPNVTLRHGRTDGALGSVDGMDTAGVISFNAALRRAWAEDGRSDAKTVRVVLGSANAESLHWGHGTNLYYAVEWGGVCQPIHGPAPGRAREPSSGSSKPRCAITKWATVIEAKSGAFVVGGS
jgi:hypothetical protein